MMIGNPDSAPARPDRTSGGITLDDVFRSAAGRHPDKLALVDPPNRESFTDGKPRRFTFAEADRVISGIASRLREMGLPTDAVIGIQLPNIAENFLTLLGVLRAGMIAAPLPLLWRRADAVTALGRAGAKVLITCGRTGAFNQAECAMRIAAELFAIRYVCAFGDDLPDGIVACDDLLESPLPARATEQERPRNAGTNVAVVTFDTGAAGIFPVARNHAELLAGGLAVVLESGLQERAAILSTLHPASFAGVSLTLLPWLLTGSTLVLHHSFAPDVFRAQRRVHRCDALVLPAPVAFRLAEAGAFADAQPASVIAAWRSPERLGASPPWREARAALIDVSIFGETGFVASRRGNGGVPAPLPLGPVIVSKDGGDGIKAGELIQTKTGTVAMRGPMVPRRGFPPRGARSDLPCLKIGADGAVDTGYLCRADPAAATMVVSGAPANFVSIGGYRFPLAQLADLAGRIERGANFTVTPDALLGQRLTGGAADTAAMVRALAAHGINPLVAAAFGDGGNAATGGGRNRRQSY